jgi:hypothetical protein
MRKSPVSFLCDQFGKVAPVVMADLTGKTIVMVGVNPNGLGFQACKHFVSMNPARVILGCRSETKGNEALASE